jgi:NAD(P)-dependent dehydrogenase (short-subunit alcohol dehydrogenase family)
MGRAGSCEAVSADVSRAADVSAMVSACIVAFRRIDVLHNNVGIVEVGGPAETTGDSWDRVNDVNLKSMFLTCKQVLPHMEHQGKGAIVNLVGLWDPLSWSSLHLVLRPRQRSSSSPA